VVNVVSKEPEVLNYESLKLRAWSFIKKFDKRVEFGLGDARAYLSALADIIVIEQEADYATALAEALDHAEFIYRAKGYSGIVDDYSAAYKKWLEADRSRLNATRYLSFAYWPEVKGDKLEEEPTVISLPFSIRNSFGKIGISFSLPPLSLIMKFIRRASTILFIGIPSSVWKCVKSM